MDVDQSLDALIKAAPKTKKAGGGKKKAAGGAKTAASSVKKNGKVKAAAAKKKPTPAKKTIAIKKTGRNSIRKSAIGGRSKAMMGGGRAVGMAIDQVVRGGGRRASSARVTTTPNKATNDAPTKLLVSNLDFNVTEKDIKVCSSGEETIIHQNNYFDEEEEKEKEKEGRRRTLLLLLRTARRRTTLSIFCAREREDFSKKKPFVVS